ncbi:Uncharacterised protein [Sphingobacterium spiritivorum]|uniref:Uncharacterized protein n=1 Tax=Sphingobacterium spiritivorum ATCC 33861 TaxID=525373 RepID=D7VJ28_SPHSI|nr:hypothetical protein HMPREF0766_10997 [Sphingobacterium spiritivorum ATCC 33861]SUI99241.1 Uncharacterised protein [Sphingobacterium spiritivorum]
MMLIILRYRKLSYTYFSFLKRFGLRAVISPYNRNYIPGKNISDKD